MEESTDPHFKRERPMAYGQPPPMHMPAADTPHLHNYHHSAPQGAQMPQQWNPVPSPYGDGGDHRPPPPDAHPPHHPSYPPPQSYAPPPPPPPAPSQTPVYGADPGYSRQNSNSAPTRSPPSAPPPPHYSQAVNGGVPQDNYYSRQDYGSRPPYAPSESPVNGPQPTLHVQTANHEMMPSQPPVPGPPPGYPQPPHSAGPPPTSHYWGPPPPGDWYAQQRRKPVRAAQACDSCRQRKAKCDEGRPECTHCKENGLRCTYRDVPPQKSEKQMLQMGEKVDALSDKLDNHIEATSDKLDSLLSTVQSLIDRRFPEPRNTGSVAMTKTTSRPQTKEEPRSESQAIRSHQNLNAAFLQNSNFSLDQIHASDVSGLKEKRKRARMDASALLAWPAISELVPRNISSSYVLDGETERGLLRLYGCGEGEDKGDGHEGVASPAASSSSGRMDDDISTASPSGVWGTGQLPHRDIGHYPTYDHPGGVAPNGELLLDRKAVDTYVQSYLDRMYILHPFLDKRVLRKMVKAFKLKYSWDYGNSFNHLVHNVSGGTKRKRESSQSPHSITDDQPLHTIPHYNSRPPLSNKSPIEHSVSNAIILLVMALGKICAHDQPLPGPPRSSAVVSNANTPVPQPEYGYSDLPPLGPPSSSAPPTPYISHANGLTTVPAGSSLHGKNIDVIPGLAYFAKAADILGELPGGVDVSHVQANLLAGVYMGQLARVIPSHWYIANACRACMILIDSSDYKEKKMTRERRNLINFAFWSCLQLESDILAEVDLPPSNIVEKEGDMLFEVPSDLTVADREMEGYVSGIKDPIANHYSNQIQLRRTINDAVSHIYNSSRESEKPSASVISTITGNLEAWRAFMGSEFGWDWEEDLHESPDINQARMRGKYYGAKYIINRPALQYALNLAGPGTPMSRPSESPVGSGAQSEYTSPAINHHVDPPQSRRVSEMRPPPRTNEQPLESWVWDACQKCIDAAIKSTTAFDKVPGRLVVTNVLGTAHAQFGNVLVLAATFNSANPQLRSLVSDEKLRYLLTRTIRFLKERASISPALGEDANILLHVQSKLFPSSSSTVYHPHSANSSFTSNR